MGKFFLKSLILLLFIIFIFMAYLSYFGIETNKFNTLIQEKANEINQNVKLDFEKSKIYLNLKELNLVVKLKKSKVLIQDNRINLSKLNLYLSIKSFFSSNFLLKRVEIAFTKNHIKDLSKITNIFVPKIINKQIYKIFSEGEIEGEFVIPFDIKGQIDTGYGFSGKILDASFNISKDFNIRNLTADINHTKDNKTNVVNIKILKGSLLDFKLNDSLFIIKRQVGQIEVSSLIKTVGEFNFYKIKKISNFFNFNLNSIDKVEGKLDLETKFDFKLNEKYKIKNLVYSIEGKIPYTEIKFKEKKIIKIFLPEYKDTIIFKDSKIKFFKTKPNNTIELNGLMKTNNGFDSFNIKQIYDYNKRSFNIDGKVDLTNSKVNISKLNYIKDSNKKSEITFSSNFILNSYFNISNLLFRSDNSKIYILNLELNKNFEINNFDKVEIKTFKNKNKNNDFLVTKSNKINILGEVFDAKSLLRSLYKEDKKKFFSKKFSSKIKINLDKVLTGTNDDVNKFRMIAQINKGSYDKLSLKGNFKENEIIEMSIYQIDKDKKTLQVISDRARPFIKNFDFIKGFEGGKLVYESVISKDTSSSNLIITDFKVSKVPALTQLLTLASLQGIADTLTGEGIRFDSFEMKTNSKNNIMNIEDALAIGPAVSILLEGYVDKGKTVSLRGTLVPATKLNSIIASIPLVGNILVGKKAGDGVVGVSFKMKGPPKNIKTTVNPIKTLTPRFILRAIENIKKNKKEEVK